MKSNNKKLNIAFQHSVAIFISIVIVISCCFIPVFADNEPVNLMSPMTINTHYLFYNDTRWNNTNYTNTYVDTSYSSSSASPIYCAWVDNWIGNSGVRFSGVVLCSLSHFDANFKFCQSDGTSIAILNGSSQISTDSNGNTYYRFIPFLNKTSETTYYGSYPTGLATLDFISCNGQQDSIDFLYNALTTSPLVDGIEFTYSIPAGNVAFFDIENLSNFDGFTLTTTMPDQSSLLGPPWWASTQKYGFTNTLPEDGTSVSGLTDIDWEKGANGGVFGLTQSAKFDPVGPFPSYKYLVIYNPLYYGGTENGPYEWQDNGSITISVNCSSVTVFSLLSQVGPSGSGTGSATVNTNVDGDPYEGTVDPDTGTVSWEQNGETSEGPQTGGSNTAGVAKSIHDWLENIANQISGFFTGAIGAVNTIISAISNFVGTLKSLYMWLPSPVYALLTSAIMVAITIGVVKVFV